MAEKIRIDDLANPQLTDMQKAALAFGESQDVDLTVDAVLGAAVAALALVAAPVPVAVVAVAAVHDADQAPGAVRTAGRPADQHPRRHGANIEQSGRVAPVPAEGRLTEALTAGEARERRPYACGGVSDARSTAQGVLCPKKRILWVRVTADDQ